MLVGFQEPQPSTGSDRFMSTFDEQPKYHGASEFAKSAVELEPQSPAQKMAKEEGIMKMLMTLNEGVRALGSRFDTH